MRRLSVILSLFTFVFILIHCQIGWYTKEINSSEGRPFRLSHPLSLNSSKPKFCLVAKIRYKAPRHKEFNYRIDPIQEVYEMGKVMIEEPSYVGLEPEFLNFLQSRLKSKYQFQLKKVIYDIPESFRQNKVLESLKSNRSFVRYSEINKKWKNNIVLAEVLKTYADIIDSQTEFFYGTDNPVQNDLGDCDETLYFAEVQKESKDNRFYITLARITFWVFPEYNQESHHYTVIRRNKLEKTQETFQFSMGYEKWISVFFLPTFNLFANVSDFHMEYRFSEESEEMFLDALTEELNK